MTAASTTITAPSADAPVISLYTPRYIDIGINLTDPMFSGVYDQKMHHDSDMDDIIDRAKQSGIQKLLVTGSNLKESRQAIELANKYRTFIGFPDLPSQAASPNALTHLR